MSNQNFDQLDPIVEITEDAAFPLNVTEATIRKSGKATKEQLANLPNFLDTPRFHAYMEGPFTVPNGTATEIDLNLEYFEEVGGTWFNSAFPTVVIVPENGLYLATFAALCSSGSGFACVDLVHRVFPAGPPRDLIIGGNSLPLASPRPVLSASGSNLCFAGNTLKFSVYQDTGADLDLSEIYIWIHRVPPNYSGRYDGDILA